jgi:two-component system response regulator FixJ
MTDPILIVTTTRTCAISLRALLESAGFKVRDFDSAKAILADGGLADGACLIADIRMPDMDGLALQESWFSARSGCRSSSSPATAMCRLR